MLIVGVDFAQFVPFNGAQFMGRRDANLCEILHLQLRFLSALLLSSLG
jgi:hypothetical protein